MPDLWSPSLGSGEFALFDCHGRLFRYLKRLRSSGAEPRRTEPADGSLVSEDCRFAVAANAERGGFVQPCSTSGSRRLPARETCDCEAAEAGLCGWTIQIKLYELRGEVFMGFSTPCVGVTVVMISDDIRA
jgi:hypothetical protein